MYSGIPIHSWNLRIVAWKDRRALKRNHGGQQLERQTSLNPEISNFYKKNVQ